MSITPYQLRKYKFDGSLWGYFNVYPLVSTAERLIVWQPAGTNVHHYTREWPMERDHLQFFFAGRRYAIWADYGADRELRSCYCDIIAPWQMPTGEAATINMVDLELDLVVTPSGNYKVLDADEFALAVTTMHYPDAVAAQAQQALDDLIAVAKTWSGPFAQVPLALPRADFHLLAADGVEMQAALSAMRLR
jgi:protein associated with RNAse G/E